MNNKSNLFISVLFLLLHTPYSLLHSQVVYEPINKDIYSFLDRLSQKGIIDFDDLIRPVSRKYIAQKLFNLNKKNSNLEKKE